MSANVVSLSPRPRRVTVLALATALLDELRRGTPPDTPVGWADSGTSPVQLAGEIAAPGPHDVPVVVLLPAGA